jgi:hypothetical protein
MDKVPFFDRTYLTIAAYAHICTWFPYSYVVRGYFSTARFAFAKLYILNLTKQPCGPFLMKDRGVCALFFFVITD